MSGRAEKVFCRRQRVRHPRAGRNHDCVCVDPLSIFQYNSTDAMFAFIKCDKLRSFAQLNPDRFRVFDQRRKIRRWNLERTEVGLHGERAFEEGVARRHKQRALIRIARRIGDRHSSISRADLCLYCQGDSRPIRHSANRPKARPSCCAQFHATLKLSVRVRPLQESGYLLCC